MSSKTHTYVQMAEVGEHPRKTVYVRKPTSTKFYIVALMVTIFVALLLILGTATKLSYSSSANDSSCGSTDDTNICVTESCKNLSALIKSRINATINPCIDFYNFSCGQFDENVRKGVIKYNATIEEVGDGNYEALAKIMENKTYFITENIEALNKLKTLYDSCTNITAIGARHVQPLLDLIQATGGWSIIDIPGPTWNINSSDFLTQKLLGNPAFFSVGIDPDGEDSTRLLLQVQQSGLTFGLPDVYTSKFWALQYEALLIEYVLYTLNVIDPNPAKLPEYNKAAKEIAEFEHSLAEIFVPLEKLDDVPETYNRMMVGNLSSLWSDFDWVTGFHNAFASVGVEVDASEPINVVTPAYFQKLHGLFSKTSKTTLENYSKWQFVLQYIGYVNFLSIADLNMEAHRAHSLFRRSRVPKPTATQTQLSCVEFAEGVMPLAMARPFIEMVLPKGTTDSASELVNDLKSAVRDRMNEQDWMDDYTRMRAKEKVNAIVSRVGYPAKIFNDSYLNAVYDMFNFNKTDYFGNYLQFVNLTTRQSLMSLREPLDRSEYLSPPTEVNAYYYPPFNQITILAGIMVSPVFRNDWPAAWRFGSLGGIAGHEMTHGFDNQGRYYDPQGDIELWWTQKSIKNYVQRQECFVNQYSEYEMFGVHLNGAQTLGENIADNGGLKAGFYAYNNTAALKEGKQTLPGLTYSSDQLYFIAWAQNWCTVYNPMSFEQEALFDVHSPGPFRVIGPMVNNPDFATAFKCPAGSPMNPTNKCLLW